MDQSDILEVVRLLEDAMKTENWDNVEEAVFYLKDYLDDRHLGDELEE